jgi:hypothetical protein
MKTGIHNDIDIETYHANRAIISTSALKAAKISSRHFAEYLIIDEPFIRKAFFDFGNAFEVMLLDRCKGTNIAARCVKVKDETKWIEKVKAENPAIVSPRSTKLYKELEAEFMTGIGQRDYLIEATGDHSVEVANAMIESVIAHRIADDLIKTGEWQKTFVWTDDETGLKCKCRPDIVHCKAGIIVDIKTTDSARPDDFKRQCASLEYPLQAIMQIEGAIKSGAMAEVDEYYWLVVEKKSPFSSQLYRLQASDRDWLLDAYRFYLKRIATVIADIERSGIGFTLNMVPSYSEQADNQFGILDLHLPLYYRNDI